MKILKNKVIILIITIIILVTAGVAYYNWSKPKGGSEPIITYYSEDGGEFAIEGVHMGKTVLPQKIPEVAGKVFVGWDKDLSYVQDDIKTTARYLDVSKDKNVFALQTTYAAKNDIMEVPMKIMGVVELCGADVVLSYDKKMLEYIDCNDSDSSVTIQSDAEPGLIYIRYVSTANTMGEVDLATLKFKVISDAYPETDIKIRTKEIVKLDEKNSIVETEYGVVDAKVYILPSVKE